MKIIANYPETEEGMRRLQERLAEATLEILRRMMTPEELDLLMKKLDEKK